MDKIIIFSFILGSLYAVQGLDPLYTVTAPKTLRANSPYHVVITVHQAPEPVNVEISLKPTENVTEELKEKDVISNGETKKLQLNVGDWNYPSYRLNVQGSGGIVFNKTETVNFNSKSYSVFIQTDKAIYQPGQIVHFRVIVTNSTLQPISPETVIYVSDSQGNRIKQWMNVTFDRGVYSGDLQLSDQVILGDWRISVDTQKVLQTKYFTIAEYVLPTFEVIIHLPTFVTFNESDVVATVEAKYTYGKPVKGEVTLNVTDYYCQWPCISSAVKPFALKSSIDGKADMKLNLVKELNLPDWYRYGSKRFTFIATVTEALTKRQQNGTNDLNLYSDKYKLNFDTPDSFKPGLLFTTYLNVLLQDGTPIIDDVNNVTINYFYSWNEASQTLKFPVPKDGKIKLELVPPESAEIIRLSASFIEASSYSTVNRAQSLSERFLQLSLITENPKIGDEVELLVNATKNLEDPLILEIIGRGKILHTENIPGSKTNHQKISFKLLPEMAPKIRVIVYYTTPCGEVVADAIDFGVEGIFKTPVKVNVNPNSTKPGSEIDVSVQTNPNAFIGLSAIDQSVLLLKKGNDITTKEVLTDLQNYEIGDRSPFQFDDYVSPRHYSLRPWRPRSSSTLELFTNVGLIFLTNGLLARYPYSGYGGFAGGAGGISLRPAQAFATTALGSPPPPARRPPNSGLVEPSRVRTYFPETFLWINTTSNEEGIFNIKTAAPDTITSYFINAFAIDNENGLGLSDQPAKLQIFRPFFVTMNLPYSVVRGETLSLQALVFNYMKEDLEAEVTLSIEDGSFTFVDLENEINDDANAKQNFITKTVKVKSGDGTSVYFYIVPKKLGHLDLKMTAKTNVAADALIRKLLVKAEGMPVYVNKASVADLREQSQFNEKVKIEFPEDYVKDSENIEISAISDIMGTTVSNIDKLLKMPYGCGEQNMLNFVPNIAITDYLNETNKLTPEIKEKTIRFMESGYQRQLTYKRTNNSFSAFGNSDKVGSTWLTSFVVKSFIQAKKYITIDENVIHSSLMWLSHQQFPNGSFPEVGTVFHKAMQGGSSQGLGLTAYVLSAFLESKMSGLDSSKELVDSVISSSIEILEKDLDSIESDYDLVFVTYVLHLANSSSKDVAFQKMNERSKTVGDTKFWTMPLPEINQSDPYAYYNRPRSVDVEMTSYALLTYSLRNMIAEGLPIMRWLLTKRNSNGGFESTQDTVVGIQALAHYAKKISAGDGSNMKVKFSYKDGEKELELTKENALILHREQIPGSTREIDISATGKGLGILQVSWSYNILTVQERPAFEILTDVTNENNEMTVKACTKYVYEDENESNMAVMEIGLPSGYVADKEHLPSIDESKSIKRVETKDGDSVIVIYFDKIGEKVCADAKAYRNNKVADLKPALIEVYDYYDLKKRGEKFYTPPLVTVCDLCETDECKQKCKK
uniref:TEP1-F n=1 Tax=Scolopendra japonica TaxID=2609777 RepID=A0A0E4B804_9MYRI|nr:thioester-containing protein 4 [Scolopendra japonica]